MVAVVVVMVVVVMVMMMVVVVVVVVVMVVVVVVIVASLCKHKASFSVHKLIPKNTLMTTLYTNWSLYIAFTMIYYIRRG